jgi:serine/threonine-protein kinase SRK2
MLALLWKWGLSHCNGLQRILRVEYDWPTHIKLSPECRDLMARILVAGAAQPSSDVAVVMPMLRRKFLTLYCSSAAAQAGLKALSCCNPYHADPARRITINEIQDHPWYMKDLPPGVKEMNDNMRMPPAGSQARTMLPCALLDHACLTFPALVGYISPW